MKPFALSFFLPLAFSACTGNPPGGAVIQEGASLLTGLTVSQMNGTQLKWSLASKTARFEDGETRIYFYNPKMDLFENNKLTSKLKADAGFLNMTRKDAQLEKDVRVESKTDGMILLTRKLFFSSGKNKIWTDDPVTIHKGNTVIKGRGFTANPDLSEIAITQQETTTLEKKR